MLYVVSTVSYSNAVAECTLEPGLPDVGGVYKTIQLSPRKLIKLSLSLRLCAILSIKTLIVFGESWERDSSITLRKSWSENELFVYH